MMLSRPRVLPRNAHRYVFYNVRKAYSSPPAAAQSPLLLQKFREDLKTAMRAKDVNRLDVVRALLNEINNASKPPNKPVSTDVQILSILRKRLAAARSAAEQFANGGRQDLKEKEERQIDIMKSYAGAVETVSEDEIRLRVGEVVNEMSEGQKMNKGVIIKRLLGPDGVFEGKPLERKDVVTMVDLALGSTKPNSP